MSYEIQDVSIDAKGIEVTRLQLVVDGDIMAILTQTRGSPVNLHWAVYGPQHWPEAKQLLLGLLELSIHADHLSQSPQGASHEKGKRR